MPAGAARRAASRWCNRSTMCALRPNACWAVLVTHQTGPEGREVKRVYIEEGCDIARELYVGMLIDRATSRITIMASTEGGMEIEEVAQHSPEKILKIAIDPVTGLQAFHARQIAAALKLEGAQIAAASKFLTAMYKAFIDLDASIVEINPLVITGAGDVLALDAKMNFDDSALYRHKDIEELRDESEEDPIELGGRAACAELCQAVGQYRLHGQRRGPCDGDDGYHQAYTAASLPTSSMSAAARRASA